MLTKPATREFPADRAREFLVDRVTEQAMLERAPLSDTERRVLRFSATDAQPDWAALDAFNDKYNTEEYEEKIIGLVRRARAFDRRHERAPIWKEALHAATGQDFYLARIIAQKGLSPPFREPASYNGVLWLIAYAVVLGGSYVYAKAFQIHEDWEKALLTGCVTAALAIMGFLQKRNEPGPESFSLFGPEGMGRWSPKLGTRKRKHRKHHDQDP